MEHIARKGKAKRILSALMAAMLMIGSTNITAFAASPTDATSTDSAIVESQSNDNVDEQSSVTLKPVAHGNLSFVNNPDADILEVSSSASVAIQIQTDTGYKLSGIVAVSSSGKVMSGKLIDDIFTFDMEGEDVIVYAECVEEDRVDKIFYQNPGVQELIVATEDKSIFLSDANIVSEYNGLYVLKFDTLESMYNAFAYYENVADYVDINSVFSSSENTDTDAIVSDTNEFDKLSEEIENVQSVPNKTIALIDTGVSEDADVVNSISLIGDSVYDDNGHGSDMYNFIRDEYPDANILSIKALDENGISKASTIYAAIEYAIESKVDIINLSLSAYSTIDNITVQEAIDRAVAQGIVVVGAAGNNNSNVKYFVPGSIDSAIIVGSSTKDSVKTDFSNWGDTVDYYIVSDSTSEASARMSGIIANKGIEWVNSNTTDKMFIPSDVDVSNGEDNVFDGDFDFHAALTSAEQTVWDYCYKETNSNTQKGHKPGYPNYVCATFVNEVINACSSFYPSYSPYQGNTASVDAMVSGLDNSSDYKYIKGNTSYVGNSSMSTDEATALSNWIESNAKFGDILIWCSSTTTNYSHCSIYAGDGYHWSNNGNSGTSYSKYQSVYGYAYYSSGDLSKGYGVYIYRPKSTGALDVKKVSVFGSWSKAKLDYFTSSSNVNSNGNAYYGTIADAKFTLYNSSNSAVKGPTAVGSDGEISWNGIKKGTYTLKETTVPKNFKGSSSQTVKVESGATTNAYAENMPEVTNVKIQKTSANKALTDNNRCYELAGAKYELIPTWGTATQKSTYKFSGVTGGDGVIYFADVPYGKYTLHEVQASKGYCCSADDTVYVSKSSSHFDTTSDMWVYNDAEPPMDDPIDVMLKKSSKSGNETVVGNASLAGAEFTIRFYDETTISYNDYDNYAPIFTIVAQTVPMGGGLYGINLSKGYKGTDGTVCIKSFTYNASSNKHTLNQYYEDPANPDNDEFLFPEGTVVITETKAPTGFELPANLEGWKVTQKGNIVTKTDDGNTLDSYTREVTLDKDYKAVVLRIPAQEGVTHQSSSIDGFNAAGPTIEAAEQPILIGYKITKTEWQRGDGIGQGDAEMGVIQYQLINSSGGTVWVDKNQDGKPSDNEKYANNAVIETIKINPIKDANGNVTGYETYESPAKYLVYGTYTIKEIGVGADYEIGYNNYNTNAVAGHVRTFSTSNSSADVYNAKPASGYRFDLTKPYSITKTDGKTLSDEVKRGGLNIQKYDKELNDYNPSIPVKQAQGDATLAGAEFEIINMSERPVYLPNSSTAIPVGGVVMKITTDSSGKASTGAYDLPIGTYGVHEVKAPTGYLINKVYCINEDGTPSITGSIKTKGQQLNWAYVAVVDENFPKDKLPACSQQVVRGGLDLYKSNKDRVDTGVITSVETNVGEGDASLAGYHFNIVNKSANPVMVDGVLYGIDDVVKTIVTDEHGHATTEANSLPYGTYYVYEESQGQHENAAGMYVDTNWSATVVIREEGVIVHSNYDMNNDKLHITNPVKNDAWRGGAFFDKIDMDRNDVPEQGDATLEGCEISIRNDSIYSVYVNGKWYEPGEVCLKIYTDKDGRATTGEKILPYGTYTAFESEASEGYLVNTKWTKNFVIRTDGQMADCTDAPLPEPVIRGDVQITKNDIELSKSEAIGGKDHGDNEFGTDLNGIVFEIYNTSKMDVYVDDETGFYGQEDHVVTSPDGEWYEVGDLVTTITTHWNEEKQAYTAETTDRTLPYGTYMIKEVGYYKNGDKRVTYANEYYILTDGEPRTFEIRKDGEVVTVDTSNNPLTWENQVVRGDVEFEKKIQTEDERDQSRLWTAWILTNVTTGERHAIVTSKSGEFNSSSPYLHDDDSNPGYVHTNHTNENDWILEKYDAGERIVMEDTGDGYTYGVWFGLGEDGSMSEADDNLGALPYGKYTLTEVPSDTNEEFDKMISFDFYVERPNVEVDLGTLTNRNGTPPSLKTTATHEKTGTHIGPATENTVINDMVEYEGLTSGKTYVIKGQLMFTDGSAVTDKDGNVVEAACEPFTVESKDESSGTKEISYVFDATNCAGKNTVVFEYLYEVKTDGKEELKSKHANLKDEGQTVRFPKISTTATFTETGDHEGLAGETTKITDVVRYENLVPNKTYTVVGTFFDVSDNDEVRDKNGNVITKTVEFVPKEANGTVDVEFEFDTTDLKGHTLVCFEECYYQDHVIATHADLTDTEQTITFPEIGTTANFSTGIDKGVKTDRITINDVVDYKNVIAGHEYTVKGVMVDKEGNPVKDSTTGEDVTGEATFVAKDSTGTVTVTFEFDGTKYESDAMVAFEELYSVNGNVIAEHKDIEDEKQTVHYPEIGTTLGYMNSDFHEGAATKDVTLTDVVSYKGLTKDEEYTLKARLMDKASGAIVKDAEGNDVVAEATFKATGSEGTANVEFKFDASNLAGHDVVAFEKLYFTDFEIANHEDLTDENQSMTFPLVGTTLVNTETGLHLVEKDTKVELTDTIMYKKLTPGVEYTAKGRLVDSKTGETVVDEVSVKFTPETADGTVDVKFNLDTTGMAGKTVVAFESVYRDDVLVGIHEDLTDEAQSVTVVGIGTTAHIDTTEGIKITDTVAYEGLTVGESYTLKGVLMNKETGKAYTREDGSEITAETAFKAETADGTVEVEFDVDGVDIDTAVVFETLVYMDTEIAHHEDIEDEDQTVRNPKIGTTAKYADTNINMALAGKDTVIKDTVEYKNLIIGKEYVVKGTLFDKTENKLTEITAETTFKPEAYSGTVVVEFKFDASKLAGHTFVVYEQVVTREEKDGKKEDTNVVKHENPDDEAQTVYIPEIQTELTDAQTKNHTAAATETVKLVDTVSYKNLVVGKTYVMTGTLMDKETGKAILDSNKHEITASTEFKPEKSEGTVDVTFEFKDVAVAGKTLVAFESLKTEDVEIAVHADINDEAQTVTFPEIHTNAIDKTTGTHQLHIIEEKSTSTDASTTDNNNNTTNVGNTTNTTTQSSGTQNVTPSGKTTPTDLKAKAVADSTTEVYVEGRKSAADFLTNLDVVIPATIGASVTPNNRAIVTGYYMTELIDTKHPNVLATSNYKLVFNMEMVQIGSDTENWGAYVDMYDADGKVIKNGYVICNDIKTNGVGTTFTANVEVPTTAVKVVVRETPADASAPTSISPSATNTTTADGNNTSTPAKKDASVPSGKVSSDMIEIVDTVTYKGLVPGESYSISGRLMDKATKKELVDSKDNQFTSIVTFKPEKADGTVKVTFQVPSNLVVGKTLVVFEKLEAKGVTIATHEDIEDKDQTLYGGKISTLATGSDNRSKIVAQAKDTKIVDAITYTNLIAGEEYKVVGQIYNTATGKFIDNVKVESTFKPEKTEATVTQTFTVDTSAMTKGETLVCYETVYDAKGNVIAIHHDSEDKDQTVTVKTTTTVQTGIINNASRIMIFALALMLLAITSILGVFGYRKVKIAQAKRK